MPILGIAGRAGGAARVSARYLRGLGGLAVSALGAVAVAPGRGRRLLYRITLAQLYFTGVQALPFIGVMGLGLGLSLGFLVPSAQLTSVLIAAQVRELCPLLAAFIVLGRSGTAVAVELGGMTVAGEVDFLLASGIDPLRFLVVPRLLGATLATLALTIYFNIFAAAGVVLVSEQSMLLTAQELMAQLTPRDVAISLLKGGLFGFLIALVSCHHGLSVEPYSTEVPKGAIRGVMSGFILCTLVNAALIPIYV